MKLSILLGLAILAAPLNLHATTNDDIKELLEKVFENAKEGTACSNLTDGKSIIRQRKANSQNDYVYQHWILVEDKKLTIQIEEKNGGVSDYIFEFNNGSIQLGYDTAYSCFKNRSAYLKCKTALQTVKDTVIELYSQVSTVKSDYARNIQTNALSCSDQLLNGFKNVLTSNTPKK